MKDQPPRFSRSLHRAPLALFAMAWTMIGCGDKVTIVNCPLGTMPQGATCVAWEEDVAAADVAAEPDVAPDPVDVPSDTPAFPMADVPAEDSASDAAVIADLQRVEDVSSGPGDSGGLGAPCTKNDDCAGGICLDWPEGYCTSLDCDDQAPCADGGVCVPLTGGNRVCLVDCADTDPCAAPYQACKRLAQESGNAYVDVCYGVEADASEVGGTCSEHTDCQGAASCLMTMPGGYCAVQGCEPGACDPGSVCIEYGGVPTCLRECAVDEDCGGEPGAERRCGVLKSLAGNLSGACISGASGAAVGEQCLNDFECASGTCDLLGEGQCSQTGSPCFEATGAQDCEPTEFCLINGENGVGSCTQPCSLTTACPGSALCEGQPGGAQGWCRAACGGVGQDEPCRPETGYTCTFGFPIGETSGQGRYLCMRPREGSIGSMCTEDAACEAGSCDGAQEVAGQGGDSGEVNPGLCTTPCGDNLYCPFPTLCVADGIQGACKPACLSVVDCPADFVCAPQPGALSGICE